MAARFEDGTKVAKIAGSARVQSSNVPNGGMHGFIPRSAEQSRHIRMRLARIMTIHYALRACAWPNTRTLTNQIGVDCLTIRHDIEQ